LKTKTLEIEIDIKIIQRVIMKMMQRVIKLMILSQKRTPLLSRHTVLLLQKLHQNLQIRRRRSRNKGVTKGILGSTTHLRPVENDEIVD
jgi:hypothetical protein